jgi:hypothetical protein
MRIGRTLVPAAVAALALPLSLGGAPAGAEPADTATPAAPAVTPGCDTTTPPEGDFFLANLIVDDRACLKCDDLAREWADRWGSRTLCVEVSPIEAHLYIG